MTVPEKTSNPQTLPELRRHDGPLFVRNNTRNQVHIHTVIGAGPMATRISLELAPAGEMDSIASLPKECLEVRGFQRLWMRQALTVSADPGMEDEITLLMNQHVKAPEDRLVEIMNSGRPINNEGKPVEPTITVNTSNVSRALVEKPCLQCGRVDPKTGVIIGGRVIQSATDDRGGVPPLCDEHVDMTHLFVATQDVALDGTSTWRFTKPQVNTPQKGIS